MPSANKKSSLPTILIVIVLVACAAIAIYLKPSTEPEKTENQEVAVPSLPEAETTRLWDLEHHSNVLNEYGFASLKAALREQNAKQLAGLLSANFTGSVYQSPTVTSLKTLPVSAVRKETTGSATELNTEEFTQFLVDLSLEMESVQQCSIGVKRIGPIDRDLPTGHWTTLCEMWMRGLRGQQRVEVTVLFSLETPEPTKENMSADGWIRTCSILETSVAHSERAMFEDVTAESGADVEVLHDNWTSTQKINNLGGVYAFDYDRDGLMDFLVTDVNPVGNALYKGLGDGKFRNVTNSIGIGRIRQVPLDMGNAICVDLNNDGWIDLLHTSGGLWENDGGQRFIDRSAETNIFDLAEYLTVELKSVSAADFDRDGLLDLYLLRRNHMPESWLESSGSGPGSVLCRNVGNWQFEDVTEASNTFGHNSLIFTTAWLDANNDNWPDLVVINEFGDTFLYVNQQNGRFEKQDVSPDKSDFGSMGVDVADINNDGLIDIYVASMYSKAGSRVIGNLADDAFSPEIMARLDSLIDGSELYENRDGLNFEATGQKHHVHNIGWSWGPTLSDFNNDGWVDIYAPSGYMSRDRNKPDG